MFNLLKPKDLNWKTYALKKKSEFDYVKKDGVTDFIFSRALDLYGKKVNKEDIFYYVYGILNSPQYCTVYANDLKKSLPRIFLVDEPKDFWAFSKAGRELADLHLNYETVKPADVKVTGAESKFYTVEKMRFPSKTDKSTILY